MADHQVYLVTLLWTWPWPSHLDDRDVDIMNVHMHPKMKFVGQGIQSYLSRTLIHFFRSCDIVYILYKHILQEALLMQMNRASTLSVEIV